MADSPMLEINELTKFFNRGTINEVQALDQVSLKVGPGEFICVIGSNGSGKTTLMGCISGSAPPDNGKTVLDGTDITMWPEYKRASLIGRVFQDPLAGTCGSMTIEENMAL
ncbi:MAG: ATP-binding cassette domain-containing protein, partial [Deltaproteobacteria bacterium]|nr:ATP-binding cassette domain-containing protein [Deltaproteobacteria bacterium]